MNLASISWLAVIACVVVDLVIGSLWYNPKTFFPAWRRGLGKPETMQTGEGMNMSLVWGLTLLAAFVLAVAMAFVVKAIGGQMPGGVNPGSGTMVGFMLWLGFIAPTYLVNNLFAGRSFKFWAIEVGSWLVTLLLFGLILGLLH